MMYIGSTAELGKEILRNCTDESVFLDRMRISLIPQDFDINALEGNGFEEIKVLFEKLRTVLSYVYLANTATVVNDKAILQFDPRQRDTSMRWIN